MAIKATGHYGYALHHKNCPPDCRVHGPLPKQAFAHSLDVKHLAFGGALGGSKSAWLANEIIGNALAFPGTRMLLGRQSAASLLKTTLLELFKWLPAGSYHWSPGYRTVLFKETGSILDYIGLERWQSIQSTEYQALYIDQCEEVEYQGYQAADWRLRLTDAGRLANIAAAGLTPEKAGFTPGPLANSVTGETYCPYYIRVTFNPNPHHWLKPFFWDDAEVRETEDGILYYITPKTGAVFVPAYASDNPHLPENYVEDRVATATPQWYKANVLGEWVSLEDEAFPEFDPHASVIDIDINSIPSEYPRLRAIDHGQSKSSATACYWGALYPNGTSQPTLLVYGEYLVFDQPVAVHVEAIGEKFPNENYYTEVIDPTVCRKDKEHIQKQYWQGGIRVRPANNDMDASISVLRSLMKVDPNCRNPFTGEMGSSRLFIAKNSCPLLPQKIVAAAYRKHRNGMETRDLRPTDGDAVDALRYLAMAVGVRRARPKVSYEVTI